MAFNFFGTLGNVARVLPGYMQGYRTAVQDNWNDRNQYNKVWGDQLSNLYSEATFTPAVDLFNAQARIGQYNSYNAGLNTLANLANMPATLTQAALGGAYALPLGNTLKQAQLAQAQQLGQGGGNLLGGMNLDALAAILRQQGYTVTAPQSPGQQPSGA